jgi:hypothetical protein
MTSQSDGVIRSNRLRYCDAWREKIISYMMLVVPVLETDTVTLRQSFLLLTQFTTPLTAIIIVDGYGGGP